MGKINNEHLVGETARIVQKGLERLTNIAAPQEKCNIMFYGIGEVAERSITSIVESYDSFRGNLGSIFLAGKGDSEEEQKKLLKDVWLSREEQPIAPQTIIMPVKPEDIQEHLKDTQLFVLTANIAPALESRLEMCEYNLPLIDQIMPLLDGFEGHVHVVTNLPEVLSYKLAAETELSPYQISGSCHVDKKRLDRKIADHLRKHGIGIERTEAFCVGYHEDPWPVLNELRIDRGSGLKAVKQEVDPELQRAFYDFIKQYGPEQLELIQAAELGKNPTSIQSGSAIKDFALAFALGGRLVNASVFLDGLYLEAPTYLEGREARANETLMKRMTEDVDKSEFEKRKRELEGILKSFDLKKDTRLITFPTEYEKLDPTSAPYVNLPEGRVEEERKKQKQPERLTPIEAYDKQNPAREITMFAAGSRDLLKVVFKTGQKPSFNKVTLDHKVRSVDVITDNTDGNYVVLGHQEGVEVRSIGGWNRKGKVYVMGKGDFDLSERASFYSVGLHDNVLYASNSSEGVFLWNLGNAKAKPKRIQGKRKNELRFARLVESEGEPYFVYQEGMHQVWATPLSDLKERIDVFSSDNIGIDPFSKDSFITSLIERDNQIYLGVMGGRVYSIDPEQGFSVRERGNVPNDLKIWSMDSVDLCGTRYMVVADIVPRVLAYNLDDAGDFFPLDVNGSTEPFCAIKASGTDVFGVNTSDLFYWRMSNPNSPVIEKEFKGAYKGVSLKE